MMAKLSMSFLLFVTFVLMFFILSLSVRGSGLVRPGSMAKWGGSTHRPMPHDKGEGVREKLGT